MRKHGSDKWSASNVQTIWLYLSIIMLTANCIILATSDYAVHLLHVLLHMQNLTRILIDSDKIFIQGVYTGRVSILSIAVYNVYGLQL